MKSFKKTIIVSFVLAITTFLFFESQTGQLIIKSFKGDSEASSSLWEKFDENSWNTLSRYFLKKSADQGNANSNYVMFMMDKDKKAITKESVRRLENASAHGHANAMYELGMAYIDGKYLKRDTKEGMRLLVASACRGAGQAETPITMWLFDKKTELSMRLSYVWTLKECSDAAEGSIAFREAKQVQAQIKEWWGQKHLRLDSLHNFGCKCFDSKCYRNFSTYEKLF